MNRTSPSKYLFLQLVVLANALVFQGCPEPFTGNQKTASLPSGFTEDEQIVKAFRGGVSGFWVGSSGTVERILPDDLEGSAHQRFILRLQNGHTLLIAHNIDVAPRVVDLIEGSTVGFYGEYRWNQNGGVIHWTHHDPQRRRPGGWLQYNGRTYE